MAVIVAAWVGIGLAITTLRTDAAPAAPPAQVRDAALLAPVLPVPDGEPPFVDVMLLAVEDLPVFWAVEAEALWGIEWEPLALVDAYLPSTGSFPTCGSTIDEISEVELQAFYCPVDDLVAWDAEELFPGAYQWFGAATPAVILAHEWAHAAQRRAGIDGTTEVMELQADCFAGAWLAQAPASFDAAAQDFLTRAPSFFAWIGDPADRYVPVEQRHGDGGQRLRAFGTGHRAGAAACAVSPERLGEG
ncbi:MAG: neutral zinc metallopeptidase [Actinomycetota bacterium]